MQTKSQIRPIPDGERVKQGENEEPTCFRAREQRPAMKRAMGTSGSEQARGGWPIDEKPSFCLIKDKYLHSFFSFPYNKKNIKIIINLKSKKINKKSVDDFDKLQIF